MATELKPSSLDFGVVVAFVAPGAIVLWGLAYHVPAAAAWVTAAADKEQGVGVFLFVLLASLSIGLAVSGVRAISVDPLLRLKGWWGKPLVAVLSLDWSKIDEKNLVILITLRDNHYRYYQFYSNTAVALLLWLLLQVSSNEAYLPLSVYLFLLATVVLLVCAAKGALSLYVNGVNQLLVSNQ